MPGAHSGTPHSQTLRRCVGEVGDFILMYIVVILVCLTDRNHFLGAPFTHNNIWQQRVNLNLSLVLVFPIQLHYSTKSLETLDAL